MDLNLRFMFEQLEDFYGLRICITPNLNMEALSLSVTVLELGSLKG